jgi:hypothetical protein
VDSGVQEISGGIFLLKVHANTWEENQKISDFHSEFFFKSENNETHLLTDSKEDKEFCRKTIEAIDKDNILESIEANAIDFLIDDIGMGNIIVRDGSLDNEIFKKTIEKSKKNQVLLLGLSKSSSIKTDNGTLATDFLEKLFKKEKECWFYKIYSDDEKQIAFVKLNLISDFVFRIDIANLPGMDIKHAIEIIASNAIDPVFIGYPYGLIDCDQNARVTNEDCEFYKMKLKLEFGLDVRMKSDDAHSILDKIRF